MMDAIVTQYNVKVTEVRNVWKWQISKPVSSVNMHVIKRITVSCDIPQDNIKIVTGQIFDIHPHSASRDLQT